MQIGRCECVYTYTGSVTDRQFVLQWAPPLRERLKLTGVFRSKIATLRSHRWEASLIEGLSGRRLGLRDCRQGRLRKPNDEYNTTSRIYSGLWWRAKNCTGTARGFWLFLFCYRSLLLHPLTPPTPASFACRSSLGQQKHLEMKWVSFMATLQESLLVLEASLENT